MIVFWIAFNALYGSCESWVNLTLKHKNARQIKSQLSRKLILKQLKLTNWFTCN